MIHVSVKEDKNYTRFSSIWVLCKRTVTDRKQGIATEEGTRNIFGKQRPEQQISLQVPRNELQSINETESIS